MHSRRTIRHLRLSRRAAFLLLMALLFTGTGDWLSVLLPPGSTVRAAPGQEAYEEMQAYLDTLEQAEDVERVFAYRILLQYLPSGTRMTSGYRSPEKQLSLIRDYAVRNGISVPARMVVDEPDTWTQTWLSLRGRGFIIASPKHTPHGDPGRIVFDLAGPDLYEIKRQCELAERQGKVTFLRPPLLETVNRCVHIEVKGFPDATVFAGLRPPSLRPRRVTPSPPEGLTGAGGTAPTVSPTPLDDEEKKARVQARRDLIIKHDTEPDLLKKVDYDFEIIRTLDASDPAELAYRSSLLNEIQEHKRQADENKTKAAGDDAEAEKQNLIAQVAAAEREGDEEKAERLAQELAGKYPDQAKVHQQMVVRRIIGDAKKAFIDGECNDCSNSGSDACERAVGMMREALGAEEAVRPNPNDQLSRGLKEEMEATRSNCRWWWRMRVVLLVLLVLGLLAALYLLLRPGRYVLEGVRGPCRGEVFPLDKPEVRVGAMTAEEDEQVDIPISDRAHRISRVHCLLRQSGRRWYLKDESTNGTKINDVPVKKESYQQLESGDEVSLADEAVLLFRRR